MHPFPRLPGQVSLSTCLYYALPRSNDLSVNPFFGSTLYCFAADKLNRRRAAAPKSEMTEFFSHFPCVTDLEARVGLEIPSLAEGEAVPPGSGAGIHRL